MSLETAVTQAVTNALAGASNVVGLNGAQTGDVWIGYAAGGDIVINLSIFLKKSLAGDTVAPTLLAIKKISETAYTIET